MIGETGLDKRVDTFHGLRFHKIIRHPFHPLRKRTPVDFFGEVLHNHAALELRSLQGGLESVCPGFIKCLGEKRLSGEDMEVEGKEYQVSRNNLRIRLEVSIGKGLKSEMHVPSPSPPAKPLLFRLRHRPTRPARLGASLRLRWFRLSLLEEKVRRLKLGGGCPGVLRSRPCLLRRWSSCPGVVACNRRGLSGWRRRNGRESGWGRKGCGAR